MGKTLLVVDDSKLSRIMITTTVKANYPDWNIVEAADGETALELAEMTVVDSMTIDVNMPGMNGNDLAAKLREKFPKADITMVTANGQDANRRHAKSLEAKFIEKPITEDKIISIFNSKSVPEPQQLAYRV